MPVLTYGPEAVEAWWFSDDSGLLPHGDGRPVVIGERISVSGPIFGAENGLHGSRHPFDALQYAPGPILNRTIHGGEIIEWDGKLCSRWRIVVDRRDATELLRAFARKKILTAYGKDVPRELRHYFEAADSRWSATPTSAAKSAVAERAKFAGNAVKRARVLARTKKAWDPGPWTWSGVIKEALKEAIISPEFLDSEAYIKAHGAAYTAARESLLRMVQELFGIRQPP
jgi:hypothetical protein